MRKLNYPIFAGDLKKTIENYKNDSFIELGLLVNGELYVCLEENTEVTIIEADEVEDVAGTIKINFNDKNTQQFVSINGQRYNLKKNLQDFIKCTMKRLLETNSIPEKEITNLLDKDYCKNRFNLNYPMLSKDKNAYATDDAHLRYYAEEIVQGYYICNHWFPAQNESKFSEWLKLLANQSL